MNEHGFVRGDIIRNNHAGEGNPCRFLLYLRKGTIRQGRYSSTKSYDCIAFDGKMVQLFRDDANIEKVGHMDEFDAFIGALKSLKCMGK